MTHKENITAILECYFTGFKKEIIDSACNRILEQEPKTGHWRAVYQGDELIDYRCSECEFGSTFGKSTYRMNYCPNCGARMGEGCFNVER